MPEAHFETDVEMTLNPAALWIARRLVDDEDRVFLKALRKVELATYEVETFDFGRGLSPDVMRTLHSKGWQTFSEIHDRESVILLLAKSRRDKVREMLVVALEEDEVFLMRLRGDLRELLEKALEDELLDVPGVVTANLDGEVGHGDSRVSLED